VLGAVDVVGVLDLVVLSVLLLLLLLSYCFVLVLFLFYSCFVLVLFLFCSCFCFCSRSFFVVVLLLWCYIVAYCYCCFSVVVVVVAVVVVFLSLFFCRCFFVVVFLLFVVVVLMRPDTASFAESPARWNSEAYRSLASLLFAVTGNRRNAICQIAAALSFRHVFVITSLFLFLRNINVLLPMLLAIIPDWVPRKEIFA